MTLNRVPDNFFESSEQSAFSPSMVVPGIEPSEDRLLHGRLFSYPDTQRYRVGANYLMLPVNRPIAAVNNGNQAGFMNFGSTKSDVNYEPSVTTGGIRNDESLIYSQAPLTGTVEQRPIRKQLNFKQAGELYRSFTEAQRANLIRNFAVDLGKVRDANIKARIVSHVYQADADYGTRLAAAVNVSLDVVKSMTTMEE